MILVNVATVLIMATSSTKTIVCLGLCERWGKRGSKRVASLNRSGKPLFQFRNKFIRSFTSSHIFAKVVDTSQKFTPSFIHSFMRIINNASPVHYRGRDTCAFDG